MWVEIATTELGFKSQASVLSATMVLLDNGTVWFDVPDGPGKLGTLRTISLSSCLGFPDILILNHDWLTGVIQIINNSKYDAKLQPSGCVRAGKFPP